MASNREAGSILVQDNPPGVRVATVLVAARHRRKTIRSTEIASRPKSWK